MSDYFISTTLMKNKKKILYGYILRKRVFCNKNFILDTPNGSVHKFRGVS